MTKLISLDEIKSFRSIKDAVGLYEDSCAEHWEMLSYGMYYRDGCGGGCGIGNHNGEGFSDPFGDSFGNGVGVMLCGYIDGEGYGSEYMKENSND